MLGCNFDITTLSARVSSNGFSPAHLQGLIAWYDPNDLSSLFQDAAMTIPVSASGDGVGAMKDKSGNGHHVTQSIAAARPTYHTDEQAAWLAFDGTDDKLSTVEPVSVSGSSTYMGVIFSFPTSIPSSFGGIISDANYKNGGILLGWQGTNLRAITNSTSAALSKQMIAPAFGVSCTMSLFSGVGAYSFASSDAVGALGLANSYARPTKPLTIGRGTQGGRDAYFNGTFRGGIYASASPQDAVTLDQWLLAVSNSYSI
jgi:hypothetical protein